MTQRKLMDAYEGEIGEMLVVNGIELIVVDQPLQVRKFQRDNALWRQEVRESSGEIVQVGYLSENVIADDKICSTALGDETLRQVKVEEFNKRRNVPLSRSCRDVDCRLNTGHGDAERQKVLKQIAVVARNLENTAAWPQPEPI